MVGIKSLCMLILLSEILGKEFQKWLCSDVADSFVASAKFAVNVTQSLIVRVT